VLDGTAASQHAQEAASKTVPLADLGWNMVEKINGGKSLGRVA